MSRTHNQQLLLHQDQASFTSCLALLDLTDIIHGLQVCHYWHATLTAENQYGLLAWSSCIYTLDEHLHLAPKFHPFIRTLRIIRGLNRLSPDALSTFSRVTSIELKHGSYAPADMVRDRTPQPGLETVFGLLNSSRSTTDNINYAPIQSFQLSWYRNQLNHFPLLKLLQHPRFRSLRELHLADFQPQSAEAIRAIGGLKELRKLTCHIELPITRTSTDANNPQTEEGGPNLVLFEVIHQLPLLHTLCVSEIPAGVPPLPSTITDLFVRGWLREPAQLCTALSSLAKLKSFSFGLSKSMFDPQWADWVEWITWLNQVKTLEFVHIFMGTGSGREPGRGYLELVHSFVIHNSSQLSIRQIKSNKFAIYQMEFDRSGIPPSDADLSLISTRDEPFSDVSPISVKDHPLRYFREWRTRLDSLKELRLSNILLTPSLINCLSHLSSTSQSSETRLEHLEFEVHYDFSSAPIKIDGQVADRFCEFLGQQFSLRTLSLRYQFVHDFATRLGGALARCHQLTNVLLDTKLNEACDRTDCTTDLARSLSSLPRLTQLELVGSCVLHATNLAIVVKSNSLREFECHHVGHSKPSKPHPATERIKIAQFLLSHPHLHATVNGQSLHEAITQAEDALKHYAPPPPRHCLIQ